MSASFTKIQQLAAGIVLLMVGASVSLGFPLGISGGVLEGLQEFSLLNWTNVASTLIRAVLIVISLRRESAADPSGSVTRDSNRGPWAVCH